ncbi:hypothetical protein KC614_03630 [candidate division WWE3 bacterium]|uniref:Phospholipid/glycerol acyltransferase domain-containing protein n=1 Tax=candidate division WWE3 bacterium TaxID=2053526 RepID=A0A955LK76_UNCKA|nr:hypothetical protein [candidate division WWE3 bacterium]
MTDFYARSLKIVERGNISMLREQYDNEVDELSKIVPIEVVREGDSDLYSEGKFIVLANHIATPSIYPITDKKLTDRFGLEVEGHHWKILSPLIFRHFPFIKFLRSIGHEGHIISKSSNDDVLNTIRSGWGLCVIPNSQTARTLMLQDYVKNLPGNHSIVVFPESGDSHWYLDQYHWLLPFRKGAYYISRENDLPILPISIAYDEEECVYYLYVHEMERPDKDLDLGEVVEYMHYLEDKIATGIRTVQKRFRD